MSVTENKILESGSQGQSQLKILIVEDDYASSIVIEEYLSEYGECKIAANGTNAVTEFRNALNKGQPYDMICLDIMIPTIDGHLVLKEISQVQRDYGIDDKDGVKIVMTTALDESEDIARAFRGGCDAYIVKPVTDEILIKEMQKLSLIK